MLGMVATFVMALGTEMTNSILVFNALTIHDPTLNEKPQRQT